LEFPGHTAPIKDLLFIPSIESVASCSEDSTVKLWSLKSGLLKSIDAHKAAVNTICLMSNGKTLLSGSSDHTLGIFEVFETSDMVLKGVCQENNPVTLVSSFYNNSSFALVGLIDGNMKIWNIEERSCLHTISGQTSNIFGILIMTCLSNQPDIYLMSFSKDGKLPYICDVDSDKCWPLPIQDGMPLEMPAHKTGNPIVQIIEGDSYKGFRFCVLTNRGRDNLSVSKLSFFRYE
jgi:COMPASS component SWD3